MNSKNKYLDKKWLVFEKRVKLFNSVPFVDFALAAGSMAIGNPHEYSDFDVLVGVRRGRMFTARFFAVILFGLLGWRRKKGHDKNVDKKSVSDKICLSHWVTESAYRLSPPHNDYWHKLYQALVPLLGNEQKITEFFDANDWLEPKRDWMPDEKFSPTRKSPFRTVLEIVLFGKFGDTVERALKKLQVKRIEGGLNDKSNYKPRLIYGDDELEFHPDTRRIDEMLLSANNKIEAGSMN